MMKKLVVVILCLLGLTSADAQNKQIKKAADKAVKAFTWDIEKLDKGSLMFLDVPYKQDKSDSMEYITLTVAKNKSVTRPDFISAIVPANVDRNNGIFIKFANTVTKDGERTMELEKEDPVRVQFEHCDDETCTIRIIGGYATHDDGGKVDVFGKFMSADHVLFLFVYPDGSHKSVAVPLFSFKEQYRGLR